MDLNIINILYMFFRLAPFIIVSYFTLQSLFNQDLKGVIYLIGLLITSIVVVLLGNILKKFSPPKGLMPTDYSKIRCTQLTLGNSQPISVLPLSQTVFGYTLAYLGYFISINNLQTQNIATSHIISNINCCRYDVEYCKPLFQSKISVNIVNIGSINGNIMGYDD